MNPPPNSAVFSTNIVLTVTVGRLLCPLKNLCTFLNYITGDNIYIRILSRASRFAAPLIETDYPELKAARDPKNLAKLDNMLGFVTREREDLKVICDTWVEWLQEPDVCGLKKAYLIKRQADAWLSLNPDKEALAVKEAEILFVVPE